jgi:ATP/maltotriose-dependent transcriptional regulator MalT
MRHPVQKTMALAQDLIGLAEESKNAAKLAVAHRALGYSLLVAGKFREGEAILARGAAFADTISDDEFTAYGEYPSMVCRAYGGQAKIVTGYLASGAQLVEEAVAHARRNGSAHTLAWALAVAAHIFQAHNEPATTARFAREAIDVAQEHQLPQWLALGERCLGWAMHRSGNIEAGMDLQFQGRKRWNDTGAMLHTTQCAVILVDSLLREGRIAAARAHLDVARAHREHYGEDYLAAEIDRLEGLLRQSQRDAVEIVDGYFSRSLDTARQQGARLFELRTATAFAQVLAERNERRRAFDLLAPIYGWFTEGFDAVDLKDARAVLNALG